MVPLENEHLALMMEAGYIFLGMQRFDEAKEVFEGVAVFTPENEIPVVALGGLSFCQGKLKEAVKHYEKALKMVPESLFAKAYLGEALFFSGDKTKAEQLLKEVDRTEPKGPVGDFARALLEAIRQGYTPEKLSQKREIQEHYGKK